MLERYLLIAGRKGELRQMTENRTVLFLHFYFLDITKTIFLNCFINLLGTHPIFLDIKIAVL